MKKLLLLTGVAILAHTSAMAYMYESEASSMETLRKQGYSDVTMEIIDSMKYRSSDDNQKYVRHYHRKNGNKLGRAYQKLKLYVDPIQDDGNFGEHHIEFSNTWLGEDTRYSSEWVKNRPNEDL